MRRGWWDVEEDWETMNCPTILHFLSCLIQAIIWQHSLCGTVMRNLAKFSPNWDLYFLAYQRKADGKENRSQMHNLQDIWRTSLQGTTTFTSAWILCEESPTLQLMWTWPSRSPSCKRLRKGMDQSAHLLCDKRSSSGDCSCLICCSTSEMLS